RCAGQAAATGVDDQPADRVGYGVQGCLDGGQVAEPDPVLLVDEADLEHHAPGQDHPVPGARAVGQRRLGEELVVSVTPLRGGKGPVAYLDRPPLQIHDADQASAPWPASQGSRATYDRI